MLQLVALIALAAQAIAIPQGGPAAPTSSGAAPKFTVTVGENMPPTFKPANITGVANGDTILFQFVGAVTHTVTQSSFNTPCTAMPNGFNSGLLGNQSEFSLTVTNATSPIWFYCQQTVPAKHCGLGMVGSINAPIDPNQNTFDKFLTAAKAIGTSEGDQSPTAVLSAAAAVGTVSNAPATNGGSAPPPSTNTTGGGGSSNNTDNAASMATLSMTGLTVGLSVVAAALAL